MKSAGIKSTESGPVEAPRIEIKPPSNRWGAPTIEPIIPSAQCVPLVQPTPPTGLDSGANLVASSFSSSLSDTFVPSSSKSVSKTRDTEFVIDFGGNDEDDDDDDIEYEDVDQNASYDGKKE